MILLKKLKENEKDLLTFFAECDKVNELLMQRRITKSHLKSLKKLKKSKALSRAFKTEVLSGVYDEICDMAEAAFDGKK